jgi:hypothetical protein
MTANNRSTSRGAHYSVSIPSNTPPQDVISFLTSNEMRYVVLFKANPTGQFHELTSNLQFEDWYPAASTLWVKERQIIPAGSQRIVYTVTPARPHP